MTFAPTALLIASICSPIVFGMSRLYVRWQYRAAAHASSFAREVLSALASIAMFAAGIAPLGVLLVLAGPPPGMTLLRSVIVLVAWGLVVAPGTVHIHRHQEEFSRRFNPDLVQIIEQGRNQPPVGPDGAPGWVALAGLVFLSWVYRAFSSSWARAGLFVRAWGWPRSWWAVSC